MQPTLFDPDVALNLHFRIFQDTPLGQVHQSLPLKELAALLPQPKTNRGVQPWFDNYGKIALQFLKPYTGLSDERLLERINTDWAFQLFCGIQLKANERIRDKDIIWRSRRWVSQHLDQDKAQAILLKHWQPWMKNTHLGLCDATCYESYIKFPTDVKLLWDCVEWLHKRIKYASKALGLRRPRNKYKEQRQKQISYQRTRRKTYKMRRSRRRQLLHLCDKLWMQLGDLISQWQDQAHPQADVLRDSELDKFQLIGKIYEQQRYGYEHPGEPVPDRIVSLFKPYLRAIVRGKENKRVEFGAKVNTWQIDGLNFIEHLDFKPFHEGIRLQKGITFHHKHVGRLRQVGADQIYATNANRRFCRKRNISTCFQPKGRRKANATIRKQEDQARKAIGRARATILEGSYGNDKNHYGLKKVKARNEVTEKAWIFFGMMTANAVKVANRKQKAQTKNARAPAA